jgi:hypothetical protein
MTSAALGSLLQTLLVVGAALTVGKLLHTGLYKRYPIFFLYFLFRIPNSIWPLFVDIRSILYLNIWKATGVIVWIFYVLLTVELYRLVLSKYRGLQTVGRWAMYGSVVVSVTIAVLTLLPKMPKIPAHSRTLQLFLVVERGIDTALALFIILLLAFLSRYPVKLSRNVRVHAMVYSAFFLSSTISVLARALFGLRLGDTVNLVIAAINTCSVYAWLLFLSPAGEEVPVRPKMEHEQEHRLLSQLDALNAAMLRVSRQ